jgi:uncharacterized membrane protein
MTYLVLAVLLWIGVHVGISGTSLREAIVQRVGSEARFRAIFSALSVVTIILLVWAYVTAPTVILWTVPPALDWLLLILMLPAFILFVGSVNSHNPTMMGDEAAVDERPRGMTLVTRHPMLWSFAIWAAVHIIGNGDLASFLFFGAFLVTALAGMKSIDAKIARRDPVGWARLSAETSIIPGAAILAGRARFSTAEIGWVTPAVGAALWAAVALLHPWIIGVPVVPD